MMRTIFQLTFLLFATALVTQADRTNLPLTPRNATQTLREAAAAHGLFIGSAINVAAFLNASEPYGATISSQFNLVTAENECKWGSTEKSEGVFTLDACRQLENFTRASGGSFRNHNLCWGNDNPAWLEAYSTNGDSSKLSAALIAHINAMGNAFGTTSYAFDVVNEAVSDSGNAQVLKNNTWYPLLPNYIDIAFIAAKKAAPLAKLFYNDYGGEGMGTKSDKIYNLVADMLKRNIPIDGVGLQMHISVDGFPAFVEVASNIKRLTELGLEVHITEMDVRCNPDSHGNICDATRLQSQAKIYGGMLSACLQYAPKCKSFETWGFTDLHVSVFVFCFDSPVSPLLSYRL
jgi:endo-1,4-beta-xylanase